MGVYLIDCPTCGIQHRWFSGIGPDQRCDLCQSKNKTKDLKKISRWMKTYTEGGETNISDIGQNVAIHIVGPFVDIWLPTDGLDLEFDREPINPKLAGKKKKRKAIKRK